MFRSLAPLSIGALFLVLLAAPVSAQESPTTSVVPIPRDSVALALNQFRSLQQRFEQVQQRALIENPSLQQEQAEISAAIEYAVFENHPDLRTQLRERLPALQQEVQAAQQVADTTRLRALEREYRGIASRMEEAQADVLEEEVGLQNRLDEFQGTIMSAMVALDPEIQGVFDRLQRLARRLEPVIGG